MVQGSYDPRTQQQHASSRPYYRQYFLFSGRFLVRTNSSIPYIHYQFYRPQYEGAFGLAFVHGSVAPWTICAIRDFVHSLCCNCSGDRWQSGQSQDLLGLSFQFLSCLGVSLVSRYLYTSRGCCKQRSYIRSRLDRRLYVE